MLASRLPTVRRALDAPGMASRLILPHALRRASAGADPLPVAAAAAVLTGFTLLAAALAARTTVRRDIS